MRKTYKRDVGLAQPEASWQWAEKEMCKAGPRTGGRPAEKKNKTPASLEGQRKYSMRQVLTKTFHCANGLAKNNNDRPCGRLYE